MSKFFVDKEIKNWLLHNFLHLWPCIRRLSIGTENTYWRGCEIFYLDRKVDEETTTNPRIAPPDNVDSNNASTTMNSSSSGSTSTNSLSMSIAETTTSSRPLSCQQYGNTYSVIPNTDCKEFKQTAGSQEFFLKCPAGLRFDTRHCVCSFTQECDLWIDHAIEMRIWYSNTFYHNLMCAEEKEATFNNILGDLWFNHVIFLYSTL